ncbi:HET-domain-containing protein, partial [Trametes versicolor FP-101664 SS1]|uniref:HET-domain-containing protein n=1 Tax=Trametes versicolor (strain FP-101664) TaxID=717944 RepID=UPI0004623D04
YLALSYVWGEPQPHQTTSSNVSVYMDGMDASHLPQTLRDAIRVTHALGFQYLWVDSLCIIQDEDKDRVHEIRWMHLVYRYAHLTIIAASAGKVSDGFLQDRLAEDVVQITLPFLLHASFSHLIQQPSECSYDSDPIHERGWCLQEFYLSPRTLIFSGRTLQFRCQNDTRNIGDSFYNTIADVQLPDILLHPTPPHAEYGSSEWSEVHGGWSQIVAMYTKRAISQPSDKLVACGALAEACHRVLRVDYLAGLWRDTLLHDLLWYVAARLQSRVVSWRRPAEYRAPSWSWASTADGSHRHIGMQWHATAYADKTAVAEVIRCEVTLKDQDLPFGEVTAGCLVLR